LSDRRVDRPAAGAPASHSKDTPITTPSDFNTRTIAEFRANHGKVGAPFAGAPLLLLHTVGARSSLARVNPMMYLSDHDRYLVFGSKAGSDRNPDWYHNLLAHPDTRSKSETSSWTCTLNSSRDRNATPGSRTRHSSTRGSPATSRRPSG